MTAISVVIATRNRAPKLNSCLSYIKKMKTSVPWELIVVDNASTDATPEVLRTFEQSAPFPVTVVTEPVPGLGRAHNKGWTIAKAEIIAFTDDDCYVLPSFLDETLRVFTDPKIGYCGGRILLHSPDDYPLTIKESTVPEVFPPFSYLSAGTIHGANMIFRRRALEDIGGFDQAFGPGTPFNCEDVDACARASFAGWWGVFAPGPSVRHAHGRKAPDIPALRRGHSIGEGAYTAKLILRSDTRRCYLRSWFRQLSGRLIRQGRRREALYEIQGAIRYCSHRVASLF